MNIVTGCSGIDAIALAAYLLNIELVGQIEIDKFCNEILELRYPGVKRFRNIFDLRGDEFGTDIDIFATGIPCQPFSYAGKREGAEDDRYLWPEAIRIIRCMQPNWVLVENVDGIGSMEQSDSEIIMDTETEVCQDAEMVLETIRKDLSKAGYDSVAIVIPAASVGAAHQRYRYFIVANSSSGRFGQSDIFGEQQGRTETISTSKTVGDPVGSGCDRQFGRRSDKESTDGHSGIETMGYPECEGHMSNGVSKSALLTESGEAGAGGTTQSRLGRDADGLPDRLHGPGGYQDSSRISTAFEEIFTATLKQILWPAGYGAEQYNYEPSRIAIGIKNRTNRLKALGNSIVWPQIFPILLAIKLITEGGRKGAGT